MIQIGFVSCVTDAGCESHPGKKHPRGGIILPHLAHGKTWSEQSSTSIQKSEAEKKIESDPLYVSTPTHSINCIMHNLTHGPKYKR